MNSRKGVIQWVSQPVSIPYRSEALLLQEVATSNSTICAERTRSFIFHRRGGCTAVPVDATTLRYAHTARRFHQPFLLLYHHWPAVVSPLSSPRKQVDHSRSPLRVSIQRLFEFVESLKKVWKRMQLSLLSLSYLNFVNLKYQREKMSLFRNHPLLLKG